MKHGFILTLMLWCLGCASLVVARPAPHLTGYTPAPVASATVQTLTVTGSSFVPGMKPSVGAAFNVTGSSFTWMVLLTQSGGVSLSVKNPDGKTSNVLAVTVIGTTPPPPPPPTLVVTCPAPVSVITNTNVSMAVTYLPATAVGGVAPVSITYSIASGQVFPIGITTVTATASSADGQHKPCSFTVTVTYVAPPPPPPPPPPPSTASPNGTMIPPATQIVDANGGGWVIGVNGLILLNGVQAGTALGSKILWYNGTIYVFGFDDNWWLWDGSAWTNIGSTQPGVVVPPPPPPSTTSPDGTIIPPATQIIDASGGRWAIGTNEVIFLNSVQAAGGLGSEILWLNSTIYVLGVDANWYQWAGSGWTNIGPTQPGVVAPPPPSTTCTDPNALNNGGPLPCQYAPPPPPIPVVYAYAPVSAVIYPSSGPTLTPVATIPIDASAVQCNQLPNFGTQPGPVKTGLAVVLGWNDRQNVGQQCAVNIGSQLAIVLPACAALPCPIFQVYVTDSGGTSITWATVTRVP